MKRNTKIIWTCVGGVLLIGWIGQSCSSSTTPSTAAVTASASPTYLSTLERIDPSITDGMSEADLTALGNAACTDFAEGDTPLAVATEGANAMTSSTPFTATQLGYIITEATVYLCPSYNAAWVSYGAAYTAQNS